MFLLGLFEDLYFRVSTLFDDLYFAWTGRPRHDLLQEVRQRHEEFERKLVEQIRAQNPAEIAKQILEIVERSKQDAN